MSKETFPTSERDLANTPDISETDDLETLRKRFNVYQELLAQALQKNLQRETELLEMKSNNLLNRIKFLESNQSFSPDEMNKSEAEELNRKHLQN